ncbi:MULTISPECIES: PaaX family transcriptional regulator C-terminal domain-containing protein [Nocardioides]|uniref:PaaX family transcriptional regulator C-terminal domain-containing protein n=1 Tax=Nocardioides vastitatis TaxID=2568655 RepID=A0ABW0ZPJ1_9ACTN|nr:PaaX family transcriptional regulator C-terminal domain-containing protein [Nocardioides sp.]THI98095.1 PaaX domain-containing protein, C- domain protein [Nocardioides sp.]
MSAVPIEIAPLSARSVVLSLLLGSHPDRMSAAALTRAGRLFGIPDSTLRVALTRAVAAGDLRRAAGAYVLGDRLAHRQQHQDEAVLDAETAWDGTWEMAVVVVSGRPGAERAALRDLLAAHRLAELREGVWTRPANLRRPRTYADHPVLATYLAQPDGDPARLAAELWDLDTWARHGREVVRLLRHTGDPAERLAVAAHLVRHLTSDPLLPAEILPADWPASEMRADYASYQEELRALALGD